MNTDRRTEEQERTTNVFSVEKFHVVGRKHAGFSRPLNGTEHPSVIDGLSVYDHVTFTE